MPAAFRAEEQALIDEVSAERLMESTQTIAQWVRLSGTPEEAWVFDWLEGQLKAFGLQVTRYSFPALVSWPKSATLLVTTPEGTPEPMVCATHGFAASTSEAGLEGELVHVGRGTGQFDQDLAVPTRPLPRLQAVAKLASMEKGSDTYHFLNTRLVRERNRVVHGVIAATRAAERALAALSGV